MACGGSLHKDGSGWTAWKTGSGGGLVNRNCRDRETWQSTIGMARIVGESY